MYILSTLYFLLIKKNVYFLFALLQMQGVVYFDFFLFTPSENTSCKSELKAFDSLINYGKERFLTHPLLEGKT